MSLKTKQTKPRRDRFYIVDYKKLANPVLMKYDFKSMETAERAIVNNLKNDTLRYNVITGIEARRHKIKFEVRKDDGRIYPDRKYDYPDDESLTTAQKKNFRNKQNQRKYIANRKRKEDERNRKKNPGYIESQSRRWRNLGNSRRLARHNQRKQSHN